ncbi:MAG TPA: LytTR family DNA-binding domain-containing protein [Nocardioidaceae bacterium]|nr:LytTR family DNA-binding domain-containing protein [Nocardioidaceae bacterium]
MTAGEAALHVLVVDDEAPAREELQYLLGRDPRVGRVDSVGSAAEALKVIEDGDVDAVFLDIAMPGLSGLDLARVLARFKQPPAVVFVTAHDAYAVEAFEVAAVDYLLKPFSEQRAAEAMRRVLAATGQRADSAVDETIPVELGGVTRFVRRSDVLYVESHGDYVRLHTETDSHLLRTPLTTLEEQWQEAGFARIHRQCLVSLSHVTEIRQDGNHCAVVVGGKPLVVSRRHTRDLRDLLVRRSSKAAAPASSSSDPAAGSGG